jgi:hypothetical protein
MRAGTLWHLSLATALAGLTVLGVSLYAWAQNHPLFYADHDDAWVRADASGAPALETDAMWRAAATCTKPYFAAAAEQARTELHAHGDTAPDEVRVWRDHPPAQQADKSQDGDAARAEFKSDFDLHTKYQDWFLAELRLEKAVKQWQRRLNAVSDRSVMLHEAQARIRDIRLYVSEDSELVSAGRDFEHFVLFTLGLGGFPDEAVKALKAACIDIVTVKRIATRTSWHTDALDWPRDQPLAFWPGLALALSGLAFMPIAARVGAK